MANVLNKLLEICEILDTKGGSGGGSTGGGSGGSVSSGENFIETSLSSFTPSQLADTNTTNLVIIGRYNEEKTKDLTILVRLWDTENDNRMMPLYELHVLNNKFYNGLKIFSLSMKSGSNDTTYGSIGFTLNTLTMEGIKFLALKLSNSSIDSSKNYKIYFDVFGSDENNTDEYNNYSAYPMSNDEAAGYNLQDISKEGKTNYTTIFNCDSAVMIT